MVERTFTSTCPCGASLVGAAGRPGVAAGAGDTVTCLNHHEWTVRERQVGADGSMSWRLGVRIDEYSRRID
jgi:hypothetical protein